MKTILDIVNRKPDPNPWSEGDNIPWNDPDFSERMLAEHLSQEHDLASRRTATIDDHVEWIFATVLAGRPARVLDLGCGPGLYAHRLASLGCEVVGLDFSPASIRHATKFAVVNGLTCRFVHADLRDEDFGDSFDLVMMVFGQLNVFPRDQAMEIVTKARAALEPGGRFLLEVQVAENIKEGGEAGPSWYAAPSGLFSDRPHLVLQENFWDAESRASTTRFMVVDAETGAVGSYAMSNEAYSEDELESTLRSAGLDDLQSFPSLRGSVPSEETDLPVIVARRPRESL
ncbi:MAG: methyltransferase domain-containing protein [Thermoanaerobaculales bacterium]|jgi:SAM-dependent methyltransferase|nr:methyltransferase domain-containing protein [Thermoanaerobaculales bacterium]